MFLLYPVWYVCLYAFEHCQDHFPFLSERRAAANVIVKMNEKRNVERKPNQNKIEWTGDEEKGKCLKHTQQCHD